jgi:Arc/MetJ-type ribon-helix-helix transcriptional regulator
MTKLINVRYPKNVVKDMEVFVKLQGYANKQEFIKEATREHIQRKILQLYGSNPKVKELSKEERARLLQR